jgi:hypothetical protein
MSPTKQRIAIAEELGWRLEFIEGNGVDANLWISNCNLVDGYGEEIPHNCPDCLRKLGDCNYLPKSQKKTILHYVYPMLSVI